MDVRYYAVNSTGRRSWLDASTIEEAREQVERSYYLRKTTDFIERVTTETLDRWVSHEDHWECPIEFPGCRQNCGSYGCGN